ncbi:MAG: ribulose-bisphosphate carboxylase large subunit family protein [Anaerolineae bacterium]|nr:ribulose-bisphosphate carboxylase large subunit family protein [Anaerolineae bacterium]MDW8172703.1 ribulose-bisphosphate carboxylase large subunit family protein [Anaerolineae bacterium]
MQDAILATYLIETQHPLEKAAQVMAGEQSAGTFVRVPGETPELLEKHGAKILEITPLEAVSAPSLPGAKPPRQSHSSQWQRARVVIAYPFDNVGLSLATLITTLSGNLYELGPFSGLKLLDVEIPAVFQSRYPGPKFGVAGTRQMAGVFDRPMIGTIVKPSVGLSPDQTAELVRTLCEAGLDFIKDDELQTNSPHSPLEARVKAVMAVINDHHVKTGKKVMYAFNITADLDDMRRHHDIVLAHGGTCIMVNMLAVGPVALRAISQHTQLPIHGHRAGWGALSRHPLLGMEYVAFQKLMRLAGADHLHVNGLRNKFCESDESVIASARACLSPLFQAQDVAMPVFSSGQSTLQVADTYRALNSVDLLYLAGGGIMAHPLGPAAGVASLRQAWDAALQGIDLHEYARDHVELRQSLEMFAAL